MRLSIFENDTNLGDDIDDLLAISQSIQSGTLYSPPSVNPTPPPLPAETWDAWFKRNQTPIILGGGALALVLLLMSRK